MSRMSGFNSKFGGGGARCQGIHSFLHTLIEYNDIYPDSEATLALCG